jgi:hypothetical protein
LEKHVCPVFRVEEYFCTKLGGIIFNSLVVVSNHSVKNVNWIASETAEATDVWRTSVDIEEIIHLQ